MFFFLHLQHTVTGLDHLHVQRFLKYLPPCVTAPLLTLIPAYLSDFQLSYQICTSPVFFSTNYRCIQIVVFPGDESSVSTSEEMQIMSSWLKPAVKSILISPLFAHCECCLSAVIKRVGCFTCVCGRMAFKLKLQYFSLNCLEMDTSSEIFLLHQKLCC